MKKLHYAMVAFVMLLVLSYAIMNFSELMKFPSITGNALMSTRLVITQKISVDCNMSLEQGWNLVSFPCISNAVGPQTFLENLSEYRDLRYYNVRDSNDPWKSYNPDLPSWVVQDLSSISRAYGYWIYLDSDTRLMISNELATPTVTDVYEGWNLLGYPNRTSKPINDTFGNMIPNFDYVHMYNASDSIDQWKQWTWNSSLASDQDFNYTNPNYGYWIYMINDDTFRIS